MLIFWGDGSDASKSLVDAIIVRSTENFNWTFIFILSVVFYVYWDNIQKKHFDVIAAGLATYGVHWIYEIGNAAIAHIWGYPLWSVSNESTTYIILIGVCWELSMMFSLSGMICYKMLPQDKKTRYFASKNFKGIDCRLAGALSMALLFALVESFLAGTSNHSFIWVYKWWGVLPVFVTTYIPFFLACNYINDLPGKKKWKVLGILWGCVALLLVTLIPAGII
ncbi:MAG: hypothetical protein IJM15_03320 [Erysipelotrichaceae bacterium]|nr:hypothetical protein [Erysipelotrichaceae bacterium]